MLDALNPKKNLKTRFDEISDIASYAKNLPKEAKEWLAAFVEEEINANFNHSGEKLNDSSDPKVRSRIYNRNNQRNSCIQTREQAQGKISYLDDIDIDRERKVKEEDSYD